MDKLEEAFKKAKLINMQKAKVMACIENKVCPNCAREGIVKTEACVYVCHLCSWNSNKLPFDIT